MRPHSVSMRTNVSLSSINFLRHPNNLTIFGNVLYWLSIVVCKAYGCTSEAPGGMWWQNFIFCSFINNRIDVVVQNKNQAGTVFFLPPGFDLSPFDPKINGFLGLMVEHFYFKFGDPGFIGFCDMRKNRHTHTHTHTHVHTRWRKP